MKQLPTAQEFLTKWQDSFLTTKPVITESLKKQFIEFAKLHVKAALEVAADNAETITCDEHGGDICDIDKESILNAYPDGNIK